MAKGDRRRRPNQGGATESGEASVYTRIRINEQNIMNLQDKVQMLSKNFLNLKKEVRDRLSESSGGASKVGENLKKRIEKIEEKVEKLEKFGVEKGKKEEEIKKGMTEEEADKALDDILKKTGEK